MFSSVADETDDAPFRTKYKRVNQRNSRRHAGVRPRKLAPHGTVSAYRRHGRAEPPEECCDLCHQAWNADARRNRARRKIKKWTPILADAKADLADLRASGAHADDIAKARAAVAKAKAKIAEARQAKVAAETALAELKAAGVAQAEAEAKAARKR